MAAKVILIQASPRRVADGVVETVYLAGGGAEAPYYYGGNHYKAGVAKLPTMITSLAFDGADFGTGGIPQAAEIEWAPALSADLAAMAGYFWPDAAITVQIGPEGTAPPTVLSGKVLDAPVDGATLKLMLSDPAADLKKPLLTSRYAGTGGIEGPAEWEGKIKRRIWGRVWNLAGEPIDKANNIYAYADPTKPIQSIDAVRDKGAAAGSLVTLAWAGSVAATFAALQAAVAPAGGGVIAPSIACVKWWTTPAGDLTADLKGEIGSGYVETTAEIAERICQARSGPAFSAGTVAAAATLRPAAVGWVAKDDSTTAAAMIEQLLGHSSLLWLLDGTGQIVIRPWAWGSSVASATSQQVTRRQMLRPLATRKLGYKRNETQMARGDIAGIVFTSDVLYPDGSGVDAAISAALALAEARGKVTVGGALPAVVDSNPGDTHVADDGTFYQRVNDGGILLGGFAVTLAGYRPQLAWTPAAIQPLRDTITQAVGATAAAASAQADAIAAQADAIAALVYAETGLNADGTVKPGRVVAESLDNSVVHEISFASASSILASDTGTVLVQVNNVTAKPSQGGRVIILVTADCEATTSTGKDFHTAWSVLQRRPSSGGSWVITGTPWRMFYLGKIEVFSGYQGAVYDAAIPGYKFPVVSGYAQAGMAVLSKFGGHKVAAAAANQWIDTPPADDDYDYRILLCSTDTPGTATTPETGFATASNAEIQAISIKVAT